MYVFEAVTCCILFLVTLAVFRKELGKMKDCVVTFWIPKKRVKAKDDKRKREETEGIRIKSATLLPQSDSRSILEDFTSQKLDEKSAQLSESDSTKNVDPFPPFSDILKTSPQGTARTPIENTTSSKTEQVTHDDNGFVKTTVETKHEVIGNTEVSFSKKEQESVSSKSTTDGVPNITMDAMDLNDLISATQKRLDSFKSGYKSPPPATESIANSYGTKKTSTTKSVTEKKIEETSSFSSFNSSASPFAGKILDSNTVDSMVNSNKDLDSLNGGLGFNSDESSFVSTETPFGSTIITKKKKMFTSSSFFDEPEALYPTVEEQVEMAKKIADSLTVDTNQKSKGANMFYKRVKKSTKWIHEGPEPSDESGSETPDIPGVEPPTPDPSQVPFRPSKGPTKLKLVMDSRHPIDLKELKSTGLVFNEHNVISPQICHGLVKDLHSPVGKGAALFAKRKKKSEDWVVDEARVMSMVKQNERRSATLPQTPTSYNQYSTFSRQDVKLVKSPWAAAMESPLGLCDAAFSRVNPDQLADTVIRAADTKRRNSNTPTVSRQPSRLEGCLSPPPMTPLAAQYDIYHAKAPKGWQGFGTSTVDSSNIYQSPSIQQQAPQDYSQFQNEYQPLKKMTFQNFNTLPRLWKGSSAR
ncbi:hypothetical protein JTE90_010959 [Oedothorax gibbosus]|uniref:Uncharacterized protein n=1 Tax=Oedothorax gibbosus TaxID=931172 RepID=A0AAV6UBF6_9ARAC|nr:hypothetical protein JTE90_010959 [Oedothorax gibbosus]